MKDISIQDYVGGTPPGLDAKALLKDLDLLPKDWLGGRLGQDTSDLLSEVFKQYPEFRPYFEQKAAMECLEEHLGIRIPRVAGELGFIPPVDGDDGITAKVYAEIQKRDTSLAPRLASLRQHMPVYPLTKILADYKSAYTTYRTKIDKAHPSKLRILGRKGSDTRVTRPSPNDPRLNALIKELDLANGVVVGSVAALDAAAKRFEESLPVTPDGRVQVPLLRTAREHAALARVVRQAWSDVIK